MKLAMVCVGSGQGQRFGGDKLAADLAGRSVLERALTALREAFPEAPVVVALPRSRIEAWRQRLAGSLAGVRCVAGGERRQDSVRLAVGAVPEAEVVVVHDAARPLVHPEDVRRVVAALDRASAAVLVGRIADTVKRVDAGGRVLSTVDREGLRAAQTPQVFRVAELEAAWIRCDPRQPWTDEAAMLEACGREVLTVESTYPNPKITLPEDLAVARALLELRR